MVIKAISTSFSAEDAVFVEKMNNLSSEEQRLLIIQKAKELEWKHYDSKSERLDRKNRNFHYIVMDDLVRDLRIQRTEYMNKIKGNIIIWTLWNKQHRIEGSFGEVLYQLIKFANGG